MAKKSAKKPRPAPEAPYGVVFCGGGTKGAYQLGVWKYLKEIGMDGRITAVSGASVGSLNSALFVAGDLDGAVAAWKSMEQSDFPKITPKRVVKKLLHIPFRGLMKRDKLKSILEQYLPDAVRTDKLVYSSVAIYNSPKRMAKKTVKQFVQSSPKAAKKLRRVLKKSKKAKKSPRKLLRLSTLAAKKLRGIVKHPKKSLYKLGRVVAKGAGKLLPHKKKKHRKRKVKRKAAAAVKGMFRVVSRIDYCCWSGLSADDIRDVILGSAAFPGAYRHVSYHGKKLADGGIWDNAPVRPLVEAGCKTVIVIHLSEDSKRETVKQRAHLKGLDLSGCAILDVCPSQSLKSMFKISEELTDARMELGYRDAAEQLARKLPAIP